MTYEFTEEQNVVIADLAKYMKMVAIIIIAVGIVDLIDNLMEGSYLNLISTSALIALGTKFV